MSSRIPFKLEFEDYTPEELLQIFNKFIKDGNFKMSKECEELLLEDFRKNANRKNIGNGRYVRNLYERTKIIQANRIMRSNSISRSINYIRIVDIQKAINQMKEIAPEKRPIGFRTDIADAC